MLLRQYVFRLTYFSQNGDDRNPKFFSFSQVRIMSRNTWKDFLHVLKVFQLAIKSAFLMRSTLVYRASSISLKKRPISFFEILLIAQISVK